MCIHVTQRRVTHAAPEHARITEPEHMATATATHSEPIPATPSARMPAPTSPRPRARIAAIIPAAALLACACLPLAACGGPAAARPAQPAGEPPPETLIPGRLDSAQPFFIPGETMSFELSYQGILMGRAVLAVGHPGMVDGRSVLIIRSLFETAGAVKIFKSLRDDVRTHLDWRTGAPIEHSSELTTSDRHIQASTQLTGELAIIHYQRDDKPVRLIRVVLPRGETVHDMHSILGALRNWDPVPGATVHVYSISGRRVWRSELRFEASETVRTAMGLRAALRIDGVATRLEHRTLEPDPKKPPRGITLWLSDDARRIPLRVVARTEYGELQAELVDYQRPEPTLSRR